MKENEIQGENENQLIDFIAIYGEAKLINYLSKSLLDKELIIKEHDLNHIVNIKTSLN